MKLHISFFISNIYDDSKCVYVGPSDNAHNVTSVGRKRTFNMRIKLNFKLPQLQTNIKMSPDYIESH